MELWIRSQNKRDLIKINNISLSENDTTIITYVIEFGSLELAEYKTKERALEVLDEIQKRLKNNVSYEENSLYLSNGYNYFKIPYEESSQVYEMPKN